ncbi:transglycosylase SLT domain-containing protein [Sphingomonas sp.]|uniref:transglycosylase SLT domain-containing protein n=1 Tax=Sphingomonas sp. TaxID=28214 RepID=UPI0031D7C5B1
MQAYDLTRLTEGLLGQVGIQGQIINDARNTQLAQQQAGAQTALLNAQATEAQRQAEQQKAYDAAVAQYLAKPDAAGLSALAARFPKQAEALKQAWAVKEAAQKTADLRVLGSAHAALRAGRADLAIKQLTARRDAEKARGIDTSGLDDQIAALQSGDKAAIRAVEGGLLAEISAGSDPEKFGATYENVGGEVQNGFTLSPGSRRFDADGKLIATAPFAPRPVSVGEGETVIEYDPNSGGGDPPSGDAGDGDIVSRMLPITLQSESGNRDYAANGQPLTSSAGAVGRMQVMPGTNRDPGFGVRPAQDDSMEERARVGRDYLSAMVQRYGNPAQAWAAYNAGPGRVDQAIQEGGQNWLQRLPQETQAYVRKNMSQLQGGGQSGPRVIAQGAPKRREQYRSLTRDEKVAQGLNPDVAYQVAPNGQITAIGGQDNRTKPGRPLPDSIIKRTEGYVDIRETLRNAVGAFQDDYAGNTLTGGLENTMQGLLGTGTPGQRDWWANFQSIDNQIRNDLFGSALTATEKKAYQDTTVSPRMDPAQVRKNLTRRLRIIEAVLERRRKTLKANKFDSEAVDALIGEEAPVQVRSVQEAQRLAPGTVYLAPDGKLRRR